MGQTVKNEKPVETVDVNVKMSMGRPEVLRRIAELATQRGLDLRDVVALQVAFRAVAKRHFDRERNRKRRAMYAVPAEEPMTAGTADEGAKEGGMEA